MRITEGKVPGRGPFFFAFFVCLADGSLLRGTAGSRLALPFRARKGTTHRLTAVSPVVSCLPGRGIQARFLTRPLAAVCGRPISETTLRVAFCMALRAIGRHSCPAENVPRGTSTSPENQKSKENVPRGTFSAPKWGQNRPKCQKCRRSLSIGTQLWYNKPKSRPGTPRQAVQHNILQGGCANG